MSMKHTELADLIDEETHVEWFSNGPAHLAEAILAAGYRKPRTVTTVEELDALPVDSVVMETEEDTFVIRTMRGVFHRFPDGWYVVAGYDARHNIALPATVLYEPGAIK